MYAENFLCTKKVTGDVEKKVKQKFKRLKPHTDTMGDIENIEGEVLKISF